MYKEIITITNSILMCRVCKLFNLSNCCNVVTLADASGIEIQVIFFPIYENIEIFLKKTTKKIIAARAHLDFLDKPLVIYKYVVD